MSSSTSESLLVEIVSVWKAYRIASRDAKLAVGGQIHEFIHARFREAMGKSERARYDLYLTRGAATADVGRALGIQVHKVNELVQVAMAVDLLAEKDSATDLPLCGELPWSSLRFFKVFARRGRIDRTKRSKKQRRELGADGETPCQPSETWTILEGLQKDAPTLFRKCVAESPHWRDVVARVGDLTKLAGTHRDHKLEDSYFGERVSTHIVPELSGSSPLGYRPITPVQSLLRGISTNASPRDLAEILLNLLKESDCGIDAAKVLLRELPGLLRTMELLAPV